MPQNGENAYLVIKNPRASRALRQALDPGQSGLTLFAQKGLAKRSKTFGLGPPLQKAGYGPYVEHKSKIPLMKYLPGATITV